MIRLAMTEDTDTGTGGTAAERKRAARAETERREAEAAAAAASASDTPVGQEVDPDNSVALSQPPPTDVPPEDGRFGIEYLVEQRIVLFGVDARYSKHAIIGALSTERADAWTPDEAKALLDAFAEKETQSA